MDRAFCFVWKAGRAVVLSWETSHKVLVQAKVPMATITPPVVIEGDGELTVYSTLGQARSAMESYDVDDGLYQAFDSAGYPLRLSTVGLLVVIELPGDSTPDPDELARRLRSHISDLGTDRVGIDDLAGASVGTMLSALQSFQREWRGRSSGLLSRLHAWLWPVP